MPRLLSVAPGATTGFDFGRNAFWRLQIAADAFNGQTPALSLMCTYPPGVQFRALDGAAIPTVVSIAKVPLRLAGSVEEAHRVASVMLDAGNQEQDQARTREACNMWKNAPRAPRQEDIDHAAQDAILLVDLYWRIANWLMEGARERWEVSIMDTTKVAGIP